MNVNDLPDEALEMIFALFELPTLLLVIRRVCRRWFRLSRSPWVLGAIKFSLPAALVLERRLDEPDLACCGPGYSTICHYRRFARILEKDSQKVKRAIFYGLERPQETHPSALNSRTINMVLSHILIAQPQLNRIAFVNLIFNEPLGGRAIGRWPIANGVTRISFENCSFKFFCSVLHDDNAGRCCYRHSLLLIRREIMIQVSHRYELTVPQVESFCNPVCSRSFRSINAELFNDCCVPFGPGELDHLKMWFQSHPSAGTCALHTMRRMCGKYDPATLEALLRITSVDAVEFRHVKPIVLRLMQIWQAAYPTGGPVVLFQSPLD